MAMQPADEACCYASARVGAIMRHLSKEITERPAAVTPSMDAELHGLRAIVTQLSATGSCFRGLKLVLFQLAVVEKCRTAPATAARKSELPMARSSASLALSDRSMLGHILQFVGRRSWLYIAGVGPHWRGTYMATCAMHFGFAHLLRTAWREAFSSVDAFIAAADAAALEERHRHALRRHLGRWRTQEVLACALACAAGAGVDSPLHGSMLASAAESGRPDWFVHLRGQLVRRQLLVWRTPSEQPLRRRGNWGFDIKRNHFDALPDEWLDEGVLHGCFTPDVFHLDEDDKYHILSETAVRAGHLHIVRYIVDAMPRCISADAVALALRMERLDIAKALMRSWRGFEEELMDDVMPMLARQRNSPVELFALGWDYIDGWRYETLLMVLRTAQESGNAPLVAWLRKQGVC
ncbi:hypothetical protein JKP88DRAFT_246670 [Tribonema minus]|uniref:Uncharacterized protein n=1 Tax=Tribonema minus TaxID=303371 RepID=A0A836CCY8_9STRA|nr:hypothetical protein JKP88DRAFT_246670 [Tribonema minus]